MYAISSAMSGDITAVISPATLSTAHGIAASRTITVTLVDTDGNIHTWCDPTIATIVTAAKSSSSGTATVATANIVFDNGVATIPVTIGGTWLAADTNTVTIANITILGKTVTGGTSVQTMT